MAHPLYFSRPELRVPPPLTPQGEPVQAVPEKSFIQKYWIYILVALGALRKCGVIRVTGHGYILTLYQFCQVVWRTRNPKRPQNKVDKPALVPVTIRYLSVLNCYWRE